MNGYKFNHRIYRYGQDFTLFEKQGDAIVWCTEQFGPVSDRWGLFIDGFKFKHEKDYVWFLLRWA